MRLPKPGEIWIDSIGNRIRKVRILEPTSIEFVRFCHPQDSDEEFDEWTLEDFLKDATIDEMSNAISTLRKYERRH